jgi:hypothetical protein
MERSVGAGACERQVSAEATFEGLPANDGLWVACRRSPPMGLNDSFSILPLDSGMSPRFDNAVDIPKFYMRRGAEGCSSGGWEKRNSGHASFDRTSRFLFHWRFPA